MSLLTPIRNGRRPKNGALALLGGISPARFLDEYWQKKPLLIRAALPGFGSELDRDGLLALAARDDVESRYVACRDGIWQMQNGPFGRTRMRGWRGVWTVLVQGVNLQLPLGDELLRRFAFIPHARLDDLMVSYATDGGGVGPHVDNYDVFLLQGIGRRRWRIGRSRDARLVDGAPLKILRHFQPEYEWILEPGDMLYLPPDWAHEGTALGESMTWSIGFRTAPAEELADRFLSFLQEHLSERLLLRGRYADPDLILQKHPAEISPAMIEKTGVLLAQIHWDADTVRDFLGITLSEPKAHVFFEPPASPLSRAKFCREIRKNGLRLDARTRLLFAQRRFYLNGELVGAPRGGIVQLKHLADVRFLSSSEIEPIMSNNALCECLYDWYCDGFVHPANVAS